MPRSSPRIGLVSWLAGIGEPRADIGELRASSVERGRPHVAAAVPSVRPVAHWAELGIYRLLAALPPSELAALVVDAPVGGCSIPSDADLVQTITVYLDHAANVQETAAELHIHRQTLYYRLNKAENLPASVRATVTTAPGCTSD